MEFNSRKIKVLYSGRNRKNAYSQKQRFLFGCIVCILLGIGIYGIYRFFHYEKFLIHHVSIDGTKRVSRDSIGKNIDSYLNKKVFGDITRRNYFLASTGEIAGLLKDAFPSLKDIRVFKQFPDALSVDVTERIPWGIACSGDREQIVLSEDVSAQNELPQETCAYIDASGFAFEEAPLLMGYLTKKIFTDERNVIIGQSSIAPKDIIFYSNITNAFEAFLLHTTSMTLSKDLSRDSKVNVGKWYVLLERDADTEKIKEVLKPLLENELSGKLDLLEYIDLRFGKKVFYKLKNK